jgi:adenylate cyclase
MESHHKDANTQAGQLLEAAIEMDPQFAQGIAALAECHARRVLAWWGSGDDAAVARDLAERALALEPDLVEARFALATAHRYAGDQARELPELDRILALDSDHQHANEFVAWSWMSRGEPAKGLPILERITALPNARYNAWSFLSMCYEMLGRDADSRRAEDRLFELLLDELRKRPGNVHARSLLGQRLIHRGDRAAGIAQVEMCLRIAPDDNRVLYNGACTMAVAGEKARAMELLREAARRVPGYIRDWPRHDPDLVSLREDPEFIAMFAPDKS